MTRLETGTRITFPLRLRDDALAVASGTVHADVGLGTVRVALDRGGWRDIPRAWILEAS